MPDDVTNLKMCQSVVIHDFFCLVVLLSPKASESSPFRSRGKKWVKGTFIHWSGSAQKWHPSLLTCHNPLATGMVWHWAMFTGRIHTCQPSVFGTEVLKHVWVEDLNNSLFYDQDSMTLKLVLISADINRSVTAHHKKKTKINHISYIIMIVLFIKYGALLLIKGKIILLLPSCTDFNKSIRCINTGPSRSDAIERGR